jgi:hypothetical protein
MQIRIRSTGQVMYEGELRSYLLANNGPSFNELTTEVLETIGADAVLEGPQAQPTRYQVAFADGVEQIDGSWFTKYSVADMDAETIAAKDAEQATSVRKERDDKLKECDWMVVKSIETQSVFSSEWATYRQALRDVTAQSGFPWEVQWPEQPTA